MTQPFRTGYVALIGRPNAGKSTLLNQLLGTKLAITSDKPQTTRHRISGIHTDKKMQAILVDTPGIHDAWTELNKQMVQVSHTVIGEVDVVALLVDMTVLARRVKQQQPILDEALTAVVNAVKDAGCPVILLANKMDVVSPPYVLPVIEEFNGLLNIHASIPISALKGDGSKAFLEELYQVLPEGPQLFPDEEWTQVTERFLVAEVVREKIFHLTKAEIPYCTNVEVLVFDESERGTRNLIKVHANVIVERGSQKGIIIGKGGEMLKRIGTYARKDLQRILESRVHLQLFVKVEKDWTRTKRGLSKAGFEPS